MLPVQRSPPSVSLPMILVAHTPGTVYGDFNLAATPIWKDSDLSLGSCVCFR